MAGIAFYKCPKCERTSANPNDVQYKYCSACGEFAGTGLSDSIRTYLNAEACQRMVQVLRDRYAYWRNVLAAPPCGLGDEAETKIYVAMQEIWRVCQLLCVEFGGKADPHWFARKGPQVSVYPKCATCARTMAWGEELGFYCVYQDCDDKAP